MHITITDSVAYHHHLVALVERWHATLKQLVLSQRAAGADNNWPARLPLMELAYNAAGVDSIDGYSPFFLDHLRECVLPMDSMTEAPPKQTTTDLPVWVSRMLEDQRIVYDAASKSLRLLYTRCTPRNATISNTTCQLCTRQAIGSFSYAVKSWTKSPFRRLTFRPTDPSSLPASYRVIATSSPTSTLGVCTMWFMSHGWSTSHGDQA